MPVKAAWNAILDALPAHWRIGAPAQDGELDDWSVTAVGGRHRRITGHGQDEIAAMRDLAGRLHEAGHSGDTCADELKRRARSAEAARADTQM
jgi:hypothetical protein